MSRNKYPEHSRKKILDVAQRLFLDKGYSNTTIQNIVDGLDGMTKGVIYHHFKSKRDIWDAVIQRMAVEDDLIQTNDHWLAQNGLDKLRKMLMQSLSNFKRYEIAYSAEVMLRDPQTIGQMYLDNLTQNVGDIAKYLKEGMQDGSIQIQQDPQEFAEFIILTINIWIGIRFVDLSRTEVVQKFRFLQKIFTELSVPIITDATIEMVDILFGQIESYKKRLGV